MFVIASLHSQWSWICHSAGDMFQYVLRACIGKYSAFTIVARFSSHWLDHFFVGFKCRFFFSVFACIQHMSVRMLNTEPSWTLCICFDKTEMMLCNICNQRVMSEASSLSVHRQVCCRAQWAALDRLGPSDGSLVVASSVWAEVVSEPVLLSLVPSSMAPSGTLSLSSDAPSSLPGWASRSSEAFGFPESKQTKKGYNVKVTTEMDKKVKCHLVCLWCWILRPRLPCCCFHWADLAGTCRRALHKRVFHLLLRHNWGPPLRLGLLRPSRVPPSVYEPPLLLQRSPQRSFPCPPPPSCSTAATEHRGGFNVCTLAHLL